MKRWKKNRGLLLALVLCLSLTACGGSNEPDVEPDVGGTDWRTTGIWRSDGTITRDGEDTDVLVCVDKADAIFYYDTEYQTMFGSVNYPITLEGDAWKMFQDIDFADLNGDGNSDVTMRFDDGGNAVERYDPRKAQRVCVGLRPFSQHREAATVHQRSGGGLQFADALEKTLSPPRLRPEMERSRAFVGLPVSRFQI